MKKSIHTIHSEMDEESVSVKAIVVAIENYYEGKQIDVICAENDIERAVFDHWLFKYKQIALEFVELKLENEQLRKMMVDLALSAQSISITEKQKNK